MACRGCLVVLLVGCGLTLDLDERPDGSARDAGEDSGSPDSGSDGGDAGIVVDASVVDAVPSDGVTLDGTVLPADAGVDASIGCDVECAVDQRCSGGVCLPLCGDEICFDGHVCVSGACAAGCGAHTCELGHICSPEGRCVCAEGECADGEQCTASGACAVVECDSPSECVDPLGEGCAVFNCADGTCASEPIFADDDCAYCDPRTGDVHGYDNDLDGFPACAPGCPSDPNCDCNDRNPFINPAAVDLLTDRNCDGVITPGIRFCIVDMDDDGAPIVERTTLASCARGRTVSASELVNALLSLPRLDCDDGDGRVFPENRAFMEESLTPEMSCEAARGECFDYNCDALHERERPAFVRCHRALTPEACEASGGWARVGGGSVPACGESGELVVCRWSADGGCEEGARESAIQRCR